MNSVNSALKTYFKNFRPMFITLAIFALLTGIIWMATYFKASRMDVESTNTQRVYGNQRVFDYADQLTDEEEDKLEELIHEKERLTLTDIVIVTLNEPLEFYEVEYRSKYSGIYVGPDTPDKWVMVYADKFWEDNNFGYFEPQVLDGTDRTGDGVILVDNLYREGPENKVYTWMGTTGKTKLKFSSSMIDSTLDEFYEEVEYDYYAACVAFVNGYSRRMRGGLHIVLPQSLLLVVTAMILAIYLGANWRSKAAQKTVTMQTYLDAVNGPEVERKDIFIRKTVSKTSVSSSSGGSGGGHSSGGGGSHGGGGHSR